MAPESGLHLRSGKAQAEGQVKAQSDRCQDSSRARTGAWSADAGSVQTLAVFVLAKVRAQPMTSAGVPSMTRVKTHYG